MSSLTNSGFNTNTHEFYQEEYDNSFYYCDIGHPFVAFTTTYCPLCEKINDIRILTEDLTDTSDELDNLQEQHFELVAKAHKLAPEVLV